MLCTCKEEGIWHHGVRGRSVGLWLESLTPQCPKVRLFLSSRGKWIVTLPPLFLLLRQTPEESARFQLFVRGRWGHSGGQQDEATFVLCQKSMELLGLLTLDVIQIELRLLIRLLLLSDPDAASTVRGKTLQEGSVVIARLKACRVGLHGNSTLAGRKWLLSNRKGGLGCMVGGAL